MSDVTKITVNGRQYDSVEQMPPEVREEYMQAMSLLGTDGAFKTPGILKKGVVSKSIVNETITYNGREYTSRDELPPEVRALLERLPESSPGESKTEVKVETVQTFPSKQFVLRSIRNSGEVAPERDPKIAWLLVSILTVVVVVLLFLLYLAGTKRH
jgi:hypothetical protein